MTGVESAMAAVTGAVFETVLGCQVRPSSRNLGAGIRPLAAGCVQLSGGWRGALLLVCEPALAQRAAAVMLGIAEEAVSPDDQQDALRELANIIAGGLQGALPQPCHVMLPVATVGPQTVADVHDERTEGRFTGECEGWPFQVVLVKHAGPEALKVEPRRAEIA